MDFVRVISHAPPGSRPKKSNCGVGKWRSDFAFVLHIAAILLQVTILWASLRGRGVSVHRLIASVRAAATIPKRIIPVSWDASGAAEFRVEIVVGQQARMVFSKTLRLRCLTLAQTFFSAATSR